MAFVANDDIILFIESELNFIRGISQTYELILYKDFIGNALNMSQPTSFHVAIFDNQNKLLQYSNPRAIGISDILNVYLNNTGKLDFTISVQQSNGLPPGPIFAEVTVIYENFFPRPKTYIFPRIKLGEVVPNGQEGITPGPGPGPSPSPGISISTFQEYTIQSVVGVNPTLPGRISVNSNVPEQVTTIVFRNLDNRGTRLSSLENFLSKRILNEGINGTITILDLNVSNMYAVYKILGFNRLDLTAGNGDADNSDGIQINVTLETKSTGPGVTKTLWEVGQSVTYDLDAYGITANEVGVNGILTFQDKNVNPTATTGNDATTGIVLTHSPYLDSYVMVEVNGISVEIGDGTKNAPAYFSGNNGISAASIDNLRAGDELIWNGDIAGFDLEVGDEINLIYETAVN